MMKRMKYTESSSSSEISNESTRFNDVHEEDNHQMPSLPTSIVMDILSRVSVKSILRWRCVCKLWLDLLSSSEFAKLHFWRVPICPLLWNPRPRGTRLSGTLYLVEFERDIMANKSVSFDDSRCGYNSDDGVMSGGYYVKITLSANFGLPKLVTYPKVTKVMDVVNSCNGLLCLRNDPIVIYNPILRECVTLPKPEINCVKDYVLGLGFSPGSNEYKVLRAIPQNVDPTNVPDANPEVAEVLTLGTTSWRRIGSVPSSITKNDTKSFPTFLDGALHWLVGGSFIDHSHIISFKFEEEEFGEIEPPARSKNKDSVFPRKGSFMGIGELRGCLYICKRSYYSNITIWVMNDYGVKESWTKDYKIDWLDGNRWPRGFYNPIDILSNGNLLIYHWNNAIISYNGKNFKYFKIRDSKSRFVAIAHIPSFVSLKDVVGDNLVVLKARSRGRRNKKGKKEDTITASPRYDDLELSEEPTKAIYLTKEHEEVVSDYHGDLDEVRDYDYDC